MSLATDSYFIEALRNDATIMQQTAGRIYGTAIPLPDVDADNAPVPYIIVLFDGLSNNVSSKDYKYEGDEDNVSISVEVTARTLAALHTLTQLVRNSIKEYFEVTSTAVIDYQFGAQAIQYDALKPCYWQVLSYQCVVYTP